MTAEFTIDRQWAEIIQQAEMIINIHTPTPETGLPSHAVEALRCGNYGIAIKLLRTRLELAPLDADLNYFCALSLLQGRRPRMFTRESIRRIEAHLRQARHLAHAVSLHALIAEDDDQNRSRLTPDRLHVIQRLVAVVDADRAKEIAEHVPTPESWVYQALVVRSRT